jgi:hypothetical protein
MRYLTRLISYLLIINLLFACKHDTTHVNRAFYYWKSNTNNLTDDEMNELSSLKIQKLYVKFFEVKSDAIFGSIPYAKSNLKIYKYYDYYSSEIDSVFRDIITKMKIVPVVFIKNEVFRHATNGSLDTLAININYLVRKYFGEHIHNNHSGYSEIQIDCDWTEKTKDKYFSFLKLLKQKSGMDISCTLRLYPYKYRSSMGIPPVDKVTLMCYNLLNPLENANRNSILDVQELRSYLQGSKKYPLHLDIALPVFAWMQVYRNDRFTGIINSTNDRITENLKPVNPFWSELQEDLVVDDIYLRAGDKIKTEATTEQEIREEIALLKKYVAFDDSTTITLFHLDGKNLKKYNDEVLTDFYTAFSR